MEQASRRYDIDWLRVLAFYILIFFHVGMIFVPWDFHIKNPQTAEWFETWMAFLHQWRLPLLFFISGVGVYYALGKRTPTCFISERSRRLIIPLFFGMFFIIPPQIYFERISNGIYFENYWEFWKTVFYFKPYPLGGSLSWHHLWFVLYIFFYSLIALPFFLYLRSAGGEKIKNKIGSFVNKHHGAIYLLIIPLLFIFYFLEQRFPTTHSFIDDWYNHAVSFSFFICGYVVSSVSGLWDIIAAGRKKSLQIASVPGLILILFVWGPTFELFDESLPVFFYMYGFLKMLFVPAWIFAVTGYARILLDKPGKFLAYANESVYPLYILHQTVMISFGYYIIQLNWGIALKFLLVLIVTFGGSFLLYELFIKRINLLRLLFGMKPASKEIVVQKEAALSSD